MNKVAVLLACSLFILALQFGPSEGLIITSPTTQTKWMMYTKVCVSWFTKGGDGTTITKIEVIHLASGVTQTVTPNIPVGQGRYEFTVQRVTAGSVKLRLTTNTKVVETGTFSVVVPQSGDLGERVCNTCGFPMQTCVSNGAGCESNSQTDVSNCGGCTNACSGNHVPTPTCTGGLCSGTCQTNFGDCNNDKLTDGCESNLLTDSSNCGQCAMNCPDKPQTTGVCSAGLCLCIANYANCNSNNGDGCEVPLLTDSNNCGACGTVCASLPHGAASCTNGLCDCQPGYANCDNDNSNGCETLIPSNLPSFKCFGTGVNGAVTFSSGAINSLFTTASGTVGTGALTVGSTVGFSPGQLVIIHHSIEGATPGVWEYNRVGSVGSGVLNMQVALLNSYSLPGAQVLFVPEFTDVTINGLTPTAWTSTLGGITAFMASGTLRVNAPLSMAAIGYRAYNAGALGCRYTCAHGFPGEGHTGITGTAGIANVGSGGGGGPKGQDCGQGGSGGYGTAGVGSTNMPTSTCIAAPNNPAAGGSTAGGSNLRASILFGGAGGSGGADEDGSRPGSGGNGGGLIIINAKTIINQAGINANGGSGTNGDQFSCSGGAGCGMGAGAGGAGGGIRLITSSLTNTGGIFSQGGGGGVCSCNTCGCTTFNPPAAGTGGVGRIEVGPAAPSASINPAPTAPN